MTIKKNIELLHNISPECLGISNRFCLKKNVTKFFEQQNKHLICDDSQNLEINNIYDNTINFLKNLKYMKNPYHKLKTMKKAGESIILSIAEFYYEIDEEFNIDEINLDEMIQIFIYCIIKGNIFEIMSHLNFTDYLIGLNNVEDIIAYYLKPLRYAALKLSEDPFINYSNQSGSSFLKLNILN